MRLTSKQERQIIHDYKRGIDPTIICQLNLLTRDAFNEVLSRNGVHLKKVLIVKGTTSASSSRKHLSQEEKDEVVRLRKSGVSVREICSIMNSHNSTIYRVLQEATR